MEASVMMAPKTSESRVGADFCCGWGVRHICRLLIIFSTEDHSENGVVKLEGI
jgi:hypothetical protein